MLVALRFVARLVAGRGAASASSRWGHLGSGGCRDVKQVLGYQNSAPNDHPTFAAMRRPSRKRVPDAFDMRREEPASFLKSHPMPRFTHKSAYMTCSASVNLAASCTYLPPTNLLLNELTSPDLSGRTRLATCAYRL